MTSDASQSSFDRAVKLHQQGSIEEAEGIYWQIVEEEPGHAGARHMLGVAALQRGEFEKALEEIGLAIRADATKAVYFNNYGAALNGLGRHVEEGEKGDILEWH